MWRSEEKKHIYDQQHDSKPIEKSHAFATQNIYKIIYFIKWFIWIFYDHDQHSTINSSI